jgi:hypothetical protein
MDEENVRTNIQLKQKQHLYYAQILPSVGTYNVLEMTVSTLHTLLSQKNVINIVICLIIPILIKRFFWIEQNV